MLDDRVIKTAFLISFIGHCLFLGMPGINMNSSIRDNPEDIVVRIEIEKPPLLPKIDVMGEEKKLKEVVEQPKPLKPQPEPRPEEVVMQEPLKEPIEEKVEVIDPAQETMLRYQDMIKQRIEKVRRYPAFAKRQGIEGAVHLNFQVLSNGLSKDIKIIFSSGSNVLDKEAVATIQRANPFPPIPPKINQNFVSIELSIAFVLD